MGYEEALRLIEEAKETGATRLHLGDQNLTKLPPELFQLTTLTKLYLYNNRLTSLPPEIGQLTNLTFLDLKDNQLSSLPSRINQLINLKKLWVEDNQLASLPSEIEKLANLTELGIASNRLSFLPSKIGRLVNLSAFSFQNNQLSSLPPEIAQLAKLKLIVLYGNPLTSPPIEIATQGIEAIREYFASAEEGTRVVAEVKVILVGEGASGKTSLTRCLLEERFNAHEETTHGIRIKPWHLDTGNQTLRCNLWDFGGQEIMHATHQFFLSRRSLYVLVLDGRRDERPEYWLRHIESFGGGSPVLVVLNKHDSNPGFDLNRLFLLEKYPFIVGFHRTSCATGQGIEAFKKAMMEELNKVPFAQNQWPASWLRVKKTLEQLCEPRFSYEYFEAICRDAGVTGEISRNILISLLNDLGSVIHFADFELADTHILDPKWVTESVYKIINSELIAERNGVLRLQDLNRILQYQEGDQYRYRRSDYSYIIDLMKKFELCYELENDQVLIPQLLGVPQPNFEFPHDNALRFALHYADFLPPSIMPRFIVKRHKEIKDDLRWRTGVVLDHPLLEATAVIRTDNETRRIQIAVTGTQPKAFLSVILLTLREINASFEGLKVSERIPLPDNPEHSVAVKTLLTHVEQGLEKCVPEGSQKAYSVMELLDTVPREQQSEGEKVLEMLRRNERKEKLSDSIEMVPNLFGLSINLKGLFQELWHRYKNDKEGR